MPIIEKEIKAVHVADLVPILDKFGQRGDFEQGLMKCINCSRPVSMGDVSGLRFISGKPALTCNATKCYAEVVKAVLK